jgi:glycosyltransferase domain-containing protein
MISEELISWANKSIELQQDNHQISGKQLSSLSIVIPTFCRKEYIVRQIAYWASSGASVFIMDGSPQPIDGSIKLLISKFSNINYFHMKISYVDRIRKACEYIDTDYAICLADDDLYLKEGLCDAIDFLNNKESPIACISMPLGVDYHIQNKQTVFFPYGDSLENYEVTDSSAINRIEYAMSGYRTATSYGLFRATEFKVIWSELQSSSCLEATEYEHAISTYIFGKLENCKSLYWLRSHECEPVDSEIDGSRRTTFDLWCNDPNFDEEYSLFIERLNKRILKNIKIDGNTAQKVVNKSVLLLNGRHEGLMNDSASLKFAQFILNILVFIPFIKRIVTYLRLTKFGIKIRSFIRFIVRRGRSSQRASFDLLVKKNDKALKDMTLFVNKFHSLK